MSRPTTSPYRGNAVVLCAAVVLVACAPRSVGTGEAASETTTGTGETTGTPTVQPPDLGVGEDETTDGGDSETETGSSETGDPPESGLEKYGFASVDAVGVAARFVVFDDFDDDGHVDVFARHETGGRSFRGDGQGGFMLVGDAAVPPSHHMALTGDYDGDGDVDVATFDDYGGNEFMLVRNSGGAFFGQNTIVPLAGFYGFGAATMTANQDTVADLFIPRGHSQGGFIAVGQGGGLFDEGDEVAQPACYFSATAAADLDGDGRDEVVATGSCNSIPDFLPLMIYTHTEGSFQVAQTIMGQDGVLEGCDVRLLDIDDDGHLDIVTGSTAGLYAISNLGDGLFDADPIAVNHDYDVGVAQIVPMRLPADAVILESWQDRKGGEAALVTPSSDWDELSTEELDLGGRVAGSADFDEDGIPDLAVLAGEEFGAMMLWLSDG